jgi:arginyl-tRNA synthetase
MHIGNARGGGLGDCLAAVLDWAGYNVTREFYINDAGNQIEKFAHSLSARYMQLHLGEENFPFPEDGYHGADIITAAKEFSDIYGDKFVQCDEETRGKALVEYALPKNISRLKEDLGKYRIDYDVWFKESDLHKNGDVKAVVDTLTQKGLTYEKDGAIWYKAGEFTSKYSNAKAKDEDEIKDEVLVRANGNPTYFTADIAYHVNKFTTRGFERVINVWGADHHGHVARLKGAMDAMGLDGEKLDIVLMQLVRLMRDGEVVRVSKRTGKSITLTDLLDEVPIDAARFFFNLREPNSHLDFDLDLAVSENSQNPVYYVQYAHARICSILKNLSAEGVVATNFVDGKVLTAPEERALIKHLASLPVEIIESAKSYDPARITRYAIDLATLFHKFYNACRVKGEEEKLMQSRLTLCTATKIAIHNVLTLLKVSTPEVM